MQNVSPDARIHRGATFAKRIIPAILLTCACSVPARGADNFSGAWISEKGDNGGALKCNLSLTGKTLSGVCNPTMVTGMFGRASGSLDGKNVTWDWAMPGDTIVMHFSGQWNLKDNVTVYRTFKNVPAGDTAQGEKTMIFTRIPGK